MSVAPSEASGGVAEPTPSTTATPAGAVETSGHRTPDWDRRPTWAGLPSPRELASLWWRPALLFLASRIVVLFAVRLATAVHPGLTWHAALGEWDSGIWAGLAVHGYPSSPDPTVGSTLAFFPLYALTLRATAALTGLSAIAAGILVATVGGLIATVLLWSFTADLWDRRAADVAASLFCFSPGALAFSMAYSEGLLLALAVPALWAAWRRQWLLAGVLAGLATAVRPNALGLIPLIVLMAAHAVVRRREWRALSAALLSPVGAIAFVVYLKLHTGSWTAWPRAQSEGWFEKSNFKGLYLALRSFADGQFNPTATVVLIGAAMILVGLVLMWRIRAPWPLVVFAALALLPALASQQVSTKPRMVLVAFPLFMAAGAALRRVGAQVALAVTVGLTVAVSTFILAVPLTAP